MIPNFCIIFHKNIAIAIIATFLWNMFLIQRGKDCNSSNNFYILSKVESTGRNYYTLYLMSDVAVNYVFMIS